MAYSGGTGTEIDPYQIGDVAAWETLAANVSTTDWDAGVYFKQTADIDFIAATVTHVGTDPEAFSGVYDGNGKVMLNVTVTETAANHSGLFQALKATSVLKNITIDTGVVVGSSSEADKSYTGMLVAEAEAYGSVIQNCTLINCQVSNIHTAATFDGFVGGLVGANHGLVQGCRVVGGTVKGDITGGTGLRLGGVTGYQTRGSIAGEIGRTKDCLCSATISNMAGAASTINVSVGGIAGFIVGSATVTGEINSCTFTGTINYTPNTATASAGGIVGHSGGPIKDCINAGTITVDCSGGSSVYAGGILGWAASFSSIDSCKAFSDMNITGGSNTNITGGLVGQADQDCTIDNSSYNGTLTVVGVLANIGGLIGFTDAAIDADMDSCSSTYVIIANLSGVEYIGGGIGRATGGATSNCIVNGVILWNGSADFTGQDGRLGGFAGFADDNTSFSECIAIMGPWAGVQGNRRQGFLGQELNIVAFSNCYWDTDAAGFTTADANATAATTAELQVTALPGFTTSGNAAKWIMEEGEYPELIETNLDLSSLGSGGYRSRYTG